MLLGALLQAFPLPRTQGRESWCLAIILRLVFGHLIQRVDAHVDGIAMLIGELDHLLIAIALRHAYQSAESSHTMIHVYHVVANFKLLYLLQRQRHLSATGLVALQVVLMETVKYLMVGKEAHLQVVVDKTLVQCLIYRCKTYLCMLTLVFGTLCKDILQALVLLGTVGQYIHLVALVQIVVESLKQHLKVLMEQRLNGDIESDDAAVGYRGTMTELNPAEALGLMHELHACYQRHILLESGIDGITHIQIVLGGNDGILGQQRQERLLSCLVGLQFRHYLYPVTRIQRELILYLEGAHALHIVAKKVDTIRVLAAVTIHVEDRATQRKLSGLVHVIHLVKAQLAQLFGNIAYGHLLPFLNHHRTVVQRLLGYHHLGQRLWVGNNE